MITRSEFHPSPPRPGRLLFAAAVLLSACAAPRTSPLPPGGAGPLRGVDAAILGVAPSDSGQPLRQPIVVASQNGVLNVVMEAVVRDLPVPGSKPGTETLRTYRLLEANGTSYRDTSIVGFPGPTFRIWQGDSVHIKLINSLPPDTLPGACEAYPASQPPGSVDRMINCFHGPNSTNIHYHGFHVSPQEPADAVLMQIAPGDSFQYSFRVPANQAAGTHWYHPHKHGSVASQVANGMAGAFIIHEKQGGLDSLTRARGIRDVLVAVQEIQPNVNLVDRTIPLVKLVNGQYQPVIEIAAGEIIRMRLVNENVAASASYALLFANKPGEEPSLYDIARDGVQYAPVNYDTVTADTALFVAPGNRLDAFVRAPCTTGLHDLQADVTHPEGELSRKERAGVPLVSTQTVVRFRVTARAGAGPCTLAQLPPTLPPLPPYLANLSGTSDTAAMPAIVFNDSTPSNRTRANPSTFYLGTVQNPWMQMSNTVYIPTTSTGGREPMVFGQTQTWRVVNRGTTINHPFHIHINPFQVVYVAYGSGDPNAEYYAMINTASRNNAPIWMDVLPLPMPYVDSTGATPVSRAGYAIVRQEYAPFLNADGSVCQGCGPPTGQFVMHCHILGHEERGMMQILEIFPSLSSAQASDGRVRGVQMLMPGFGSGHGAGAGHGGGSQPHRH
ncbi:multicopper oxidase family protein [Longimicrobium sp.]|uniref:multicopper oxidase family protein n=1 Tax=Longimicrobium sp. TaxID=2029185 RepID=UPI003B3A7FAD